MKNIKSLIILSIICIQCNSQGTKEVVELNSEEEVSKVENISYSPLNNEFEIGKLDNQTFKNSYFGFSILIPQDWEILNKEEITTLREDVKNDFINKDSLLEVKINNSESNWFTLLTIRKNNWVPYINIMAEKIEPIPNVENALEYLEYTKWFITENHSSGYPKYTGGTITNTSINNKMFLTQTFEIEEKNSDKYYQKTYSVQFDSYLLNFVTNYENEEQKTEVQNLLNEIIWK